VAEDNALNQLVARKTLANWNIDVTIADNGRLAVEQVLAASEPFDAVLMDVQMPELDGYTATQQLRQCFTNPATLPIIDLTASVLPEDRSLALAAGMNDILAKPFEPAVLYARLAHFTARHAYRTHPCAPSSPRKPFGRLYPAHRLAAIRRAIGWQRKFCAPDSSYFFGAGTRAGTAATRSVSARPCYPRPGSAQAKGPGSLLWCAGPSNSTSWSGPPASPTAPTATPLFSRCSSNSASSTPC